MSSIEHRHFIVNRFDSYFDSINNKANLFLAVNTFLIGGLFTALAFLPGYLKETEASAFCILIMLALNIASTLFTLLSLLPYSKTCGESLIFFGDIARLSLDDFLKKFSDQSDDQVSLDIDRQIFFMSKGLNRKFKNLSIAGIFFFVEALVLLPLIITVIKNLK